MACAGLASISLATSVTAAESEPIASSRTVATLITDVDAVSAGQSFHAALRLRLAPGWHTYWLNPGDAGIPPSLELSLPAAAQANSLEWPLPQRIAEGTLTTYAYTGDVVLPFTVTSGAGAMTIKGHAEWLACRDICVPESADLELALPLGSPSPAPAATLIEGALAKVPAPASFKCEPGNRRHAHSRRGNTPKRRRLRAVLPSIARLGRTCGARASVGAERHS